MTEQILFNYLNRLVNALFKIIPMYEDQDESLPTYICSLRDELRGADGIMALMDNNPIFFSIISNLQFFVDEPGCGLPAVRRGVFRSIRHCKDLMRLYCGEGVL